MAETTTPAADSSTEAYLQAFDAFEKSDARNEPSWLFPLRKAGMARFAELGFPTQKDEDWRFTNIQPIVELPFHPLLEPRPGLVEAERYESLPFAHLSGNRLVFVNGFFNQELSLLRASPKGAVVTNLASALHSNHNVARKHLGQYALDQKNAFAALNGAFFQDGAFIYLPRSTVLEEPIQLVFITTTREEGSTSFPRNLIVLEQDAQATVLQSHFGLTDTPYFTDGVNETVVGDNARLEHIKFQDESTNAFHIGTIHSHIGREARYSYHSIAVGSRISRNNIHTVLDGEGLQCVLNGLYLAQGQQTADHHMVVEHAKPHCESHEYFNGILDDHSKGVFHGRIWVHQIAQKTDAKQTNKNLILSNEATIDTKPQLEIYADDVKCTHGATVGQLSKDAIFYLRARGIGEKTAQRMLVYAFGGEILDRIANSVIREETARLIWDRLEEFTHISGD